MKKIIPLLLISLLAACDSSDDNSGNSSTHPIYGNQTDTPSEQENTEPEKEKTISGVYRGNVPGAIGTKMLITETGKIHLYWPRSYIIAQLSSDLSEQDHYGSLIRYTYLDFQNDEYSFTNCDSTCTEITEIGTVYKLSTEESGNLALSYNQDRRANIEGSLELINSKETIEEILNGNFKFSRIIPHEKSLPISNESISGLYHDQLIFPSRIEEIEPRLNVTISNNGDISGNTKSGCDIEGKILLNESTKEYFDTELTFSNCILEGTYKGAASQDVMSSIETGEKVLLRFSIEGYSARLNEDIHIRSYMYQN